LAGTSTSLPYPAVYETEPVGFSNQPSFFNLACHATTFLSPEDLLTGIKAIEQHLGRVPTLRNGPRVIDIDILLFGKCHHANGHPGRTAPALTDRRFVLTPLADIAPDLEHPVLHKTITQLAGRLPRPILGQARIRRTRCIAVLLKSISMLRTTCRIITQSANACMGTDSRYVIRGEKSVGGDQDGMAYDFAEMKRHLREELSHLDHVCLNELDDFASAPPSSEKHRGVAVHQTGAPIRRRPLRLSAVEIWSLPLPGVIYTP
jgi:2-amino-4-hydroxy-6-hydroxymethyldihydropteridine diphosphokinase